MEDSEMKSKTAEIEISEQTMSSSSTLTEIDQLRKQLEESKKREHLAILRLVIKERQSSELRHDFENLQRNAFGSRRAECTMVDFSIGTMFNAMREKLRETQKEAKMATMELKAMKSTPDSDEVRELAATCRRLQKEKAELEEEVEKSLRWKALLSYSRKTAESLRKRCRDFSELLDDRDESIRRLRAELSRLHYDYLKLRTRERKLDGGVNETITVADSERLRDGQDATEMVFECISSYNEPNDSNKEEAVAASSSEATMNDDHFGGGCNEVAESTETVDADDAINVSSPESEI